jgi:branched-chain amino acid transport system substrate-binding protein
VAEFIRNYRAEFGAGNLDALAALGYDAVNIMLDAVRRAGSADGAAIRDALRTANLPTLCGRLRFDEHRNPVKSAVIIKIQNHAQRYFTRIDP